MAKFYGVAIAHEIWPRNLRPHTDSSDALPRAGGHDPERIGLHGLETVKRLCRSVEPTPQAGGERVTALLSLH